MTSSAAAPPGRAGGLRRASLATGGFACVALAAVGVAVPGMPTTIFLIAAVALFGRSWPALGERVMGWRLFRPFRPFVLGGEPIPPRRRNLALGSMWAAIALSSAWALHSEGIPDLVAPVACALGIVGTLAILRLARRGRRLGP